MVALITETYLEGLDAHSGPNVMAGGAIVEAAQGRNPGGTAGTGTGAIGGSKPGGISGAGRRGVGVEVPAVVRWVPMVETVVLESLRKSRSVRLCEAACGKLFSSKTTCRETIRRFIERSRQR
jgi:L-aminopeptidase/D-esterase-like protein